MNNSNKTAVIGKPFPKGVSGNPNGRPPKEFSMTNALKELLSEHNPETKIERYKELLNKALTMAMRGDGDMLKYLINRIEGMPKGSETNIAVQVNNIQVSDERRYEYMKKWVEEYEAKTNNGHITTDR
jgi:hypothetical protein